MKVGIVDDSGFMRIVLKKIVKQNSKFNFLWDASDGIQAIDKLIKDPVDILICDMEMPNLDGIGVLTEIKNRKIKNVSCIIVSGQHLSSAPKILDALSLGAVGFVSKNDESGESNLDTMKRDLNALKDVIIQKNNGEKQLLNIKSKKSNQNQLNFLPNNFLPSKLLVIAGSAGSLDPINDLFFELGDINIPIVVAVHIPKNLEEYLAQRLNKTSNKNGYKTNFGVFQSLEKGNVSIAKGGINSIFKRSSIDYNNIIIENIDASSNTYGFTPSIDLLLKSAVENEIKCDVVLLSGLGKDGTEGCYLQSKIGGNIFVQSPETAIASSMPESVLKICDVNGCEHPTVIGKFLKKTWENNKLI